MPADEARASLADLRFVNRWLGNRRAFLGAVRPFLVASPHPRLLDVALRGTLHLLASDPLTDQLNK